MGECEFKEWCEILTGETSFCTDEEYEKMGKDYCEDIERFRRFFNSPQFKKQYAKREELASEIFEMHIQKFYPSPFRDEESYEKVLDFIRTHGLEE